MQYRGPLLGLILALVMIAGPACAEWHMVVVDSKGDVGQYSSLALDKAGNPRISYYDATNKNLKYAWFTNGVWKNQTVDSAGDAGGNCSLALDKNGKPGISYSYNGGDISKHWLKFATKNGTSWKKTVVDKAGDFAYYGTSVAFSPLTNKPFISYYDYLGKNDLKFAGLTTQVWFTEIVERVETAPDGTILGYDQGGFSSLKFDAQGNPHISYKYFSGTDLKYAVKNAGIWKCATVDSNGDVGSWSSLALTRSGSPRISYCDKTHHWLKYAFKNGSVWSTIVVDRSGNTGRYTSLALDAADLPRISYYFASSGDLKYAWNEDSTWYTTTVDTGPKEGNIQGTGVVGVDTSLKLDAEGHPHISYYDSSKKDLRYSWYEDDD
jgi:hypothetical protein